MSPAGAPSITTCTVAFAGPVPRIVGRPCAVLLPSAGAMMLGGVLAWNDNDAILIGDYDVIGVHLDSIAVDRDIHTAKSVMTH